MKSSFSPKHKRIKNLDVNRSFRNKKTLKKNNKFNLSQIYNRSSLKDLRRYRDQDEISILSNANLNIIKSLVNHANENTLNESSFAFINNNDEEKEKSTISLTKWKKSLCVLDESPIYARRKTKIQNKNNRNNFILNISDFSSENATSDMKNESIKPQNQIKHINSNNLKAKDKIKMKKKNLRVRRFSIEMNVHKFNIKNLEKKIDDDFQRSKSNEFLNKNLSKRLDNIADISKMNINKGLEMEKNNYKRFLSEIEIMKINEQMNNDINFFLLKKKITQLKKTIQNKNIKKDLCNIKQKKSNKSGNSTFNKSKVEEGNEINEHISNIKESNYSNDAQNLEKKTSNIKLNSSIHSKKYTNIKDKFRLLIRKKDLYDSIDDEENKEEEIDYYISPNSWYIKLFDCLLFLSSMIYFIFVPFFLSKNYFTLNENKIWKYIFFSIDIIYIIDIFINFFRAYQNFDENLVRRTKKIFFHYLKTWFLLDFIQAVPYFSLIIFFEKYNSDNNQFNYIFFGYDNINPRIYLTLLIKNIKLYKMFYYNSTLSYIYEILSRNEFFDDHGEFIILFLVTLIVLNMTTCLFIFLGINSDQGWILKLNIQDESYLYIYLVSLYFITVTITTVGYGDITGELFPEIIFQIFLLIIGTIAYSFAISYISNYIVKSNKKSMTFEKNFEILQEIKLHHPNMKNSLYNEVLRNLYNEQLYEKKDKHLLFDGLPYSLKNKLITEMYKSIIKNFVFFKNIDNSGFIVKVVTSLKPLISIKGDIIIQEGDYINEIFFVKKGVIGLNICIDLDDPKLSLKKFFGKNRIGKYNISYIKSSKSSESNLFNKINNNNDETQISESVNLEEIKVIDIREREHFGDALMFLNERCPLVAKVKTKTSELLILRKMEAIEIYTIYPNIWKRINKKSLYNMDQIYLKIEKKVLQLLDKYKINIDDYLNKKKTRSPKKSEDIKTKEKESKTNENVRKMKEKVSKFGEKVEKVKKDEEDKIEKDKEEINQEKIIEEKKEKSTEHNDSINYRNNHGGLDEKIENGQEDITFLKRNSTHKESNSNILEKKNSIFKNTLVLKNNLNDFSDDDGLNKNTNNIKDMKNNNIHKKSPFIKYKTISAEKLKEKKSIIDASKNNENSKKNSSIYPNAILSDNNTNNSNSNYSSIKFKLYKKSYTKNEKLLYNTFSNLTTTKEKSFQLNSSYDNINSISNNKYIKDIKLQSKIKKILLEECSIFKKKNSFLALPGNLIDTFRTPKSSKNNKYKNFMSSEIKKYEKNSSHSSNNKGKNTLSKSKTIKHSDHSEKSENDDGHKSDSFNMKFKNNKIVSSKLLPSKNVFDIRNLKTPIDIRKMKPKNIKKKLEKLDKQLNKISKNIKNSSKNINNPEEFYVNLFNNIIAKESRSLKSEEENNDNYNDYSNIINQFSGIKTKDNIYRKSSSAEENIDDSLLEYNNKNSNKNSNKNTNKNSNKISHNNNINIKTKRKAGFTNSKI